MIECRWSESESRDERCWACVFFHDEAYLSVPSLARACYNCESHPSSLHHRLSLIRPRPWLSTRRRRAALRVAILLARAAPLILAALAMARRALVAIILAPPLAPTTTTAVLLLGPLVSCGGTLPQIEHLGRRQRGERDILPWHRAARLRVAEEALEPHEQAPCGRPVLRLPACALACELAQ